MFYRLNERIKYSLIKSELRIAIIKYYKNNWGKLVFRLEEIT